MSNKRLRIAEVHGNVGGVVRGNAGALVRAGKIRVVAELILRYVQIPERERAVHPVAPDIDTRQLARANTVEERQDKLRRHMQAARVQIVSIADELIDGIVRAHNLRFVFLLPIHRDTSTGNENQRSQ